MNGSWLTAGSVGTDRRNAAQWDALYADKIYCDQMFAEMITVDNLLAGQIVSGSVVTDLLFGGKFCGTFYIQFHNTRVAIIQITDINLRLAI